MNMPLCPLLNLCFTVLFFSHSRSPWTNVYFMFICTSFLPSRPQKICCQANSHPSWACFFWMFLPVFVKLHKHNITCHNLYIDCTVPPSLHLVSCWLSFTFSPELVASPTAVWNAIINGDNYFQREKQLSYLLQHFHSHPHPPPLCGLDSVCPPDSSRYILQHLSKIKKEIFLCVGTFRHSLLSFNTHNYPWVKSDYYCYTLLQVFYSSSKIWLTSTCDAQPAPTQVGLYPSSSSLRLLSAAAPAPLCVRISPTFQKSFFHHKNFSHKLNPWCCVHVLFVIQP